MRDRLHSSKWDFAAAVGCGTAEGGAGDTAVRSSAWSPIFESDDCDRMREYVAGFFCDFSLEHTGYATQHLLRHRHARFGAFHVHEFQHIRASGELRLEAPELPGLYLLELNLAGGSVLCQDHREVPFEAGHLYVINADQLHRKRWRSDNWQIIVGIEQALLEDTVAQMIGRPLRAALRFEPEPMPINRWTAGLARTVALIYADLDGGGLGLARRRAARTAERLLVELLIEAFPNNYSHLLGREASAVMPGYLKRVVEFVHDNADDLIGPDDMATVAGVSLRTLYDGFRRHCGVAPMAYLRLVRLDLAREILVTRARTGARVTQVALDCGFNHLGKFARAYCDRFGELPSETLRRHG
jgi:AraC-like DNA-binding protein